MEAFLMIAERLGFPAAMLIMVGIAIWRVIVWTGNKVVLPITTKHIELIDEAKSTNKVNAQTLANMANAAEVTGSAIVRIADQHEEQIKLTREIHQRLVTDANVKIRDENQLIRVENTAIRAANHGDQK